MTQRILTIPLGLRRPVGMLCQRLYQADEENSGSLMITIKNMSQADLNTVLEWAASEGWNPGLDDAESFFAADPAGFFMALKDNIPVAGISVVKQDHNHGFLGLYICQPMYRGQGIAWAVWQAGMDYLKDMTIGLDGVVEQQDNYRQSGFSLAYRNIRFSGLPCGLSEIQPGHRCVTAEDLPAILELDRRVHGLNRELFIRNWVAGSQYRHSIVRTEGSNITGFGTIRTCQQGHKVGPLIADNTEAAFALLSSLVAYSGASNIILDVPEPNAAAMQLAQTANLEPVFETARMYRGTPPAYDLQRLFGVTTFELG